MQISHGQFLLAQAVFADSRSSLKLEPAESCIISWVLHLSEQACPKKVCCGARVSSLVERIGKSVRCLTNYLEAVA